jgi:DNA-binding PucR family transcriptional regulator
MNDLGILHLLTSIHREILYDFSQEYLSSLIESDSEQGTEYVKTLKAYIQHQGIISEVSEALYVHPNTLRNRIKKIEDITGSNLQNPEEFTNLVVALKIFVSMFLSY